jgi:hypothetical protein
MADLIAIGYQDEATAELAAGEARRLAVGAGMGALMELQEALHGSGASAATS